MKKQLAVVDLETTGLGKSDRIVEVAVVLLAASYGLQAVESVTRKGCDLVIAADLASMSGKAKKARDWGIPVMSVQDFRKKLTGS